MGGHNNKGHNILGSISGAPIAGNSNVSNPIVLLFHTNAPSNFREVVSLEVCLPKTPTATLNSKP